MFQKSTYSDEELNAFIDNELPANEAAALLRALSEDRQLAMRVSDLTRLKAEVRACIDDDVLSVPDIDAIYRAAPRRHGRLTAAIRKILHRLVPFDLRARGKMAWGVTGGIAVVLFFAVVISGAGSIRKPAGQADEFLARALETHYRWIAQPAGPAMKGPLHLADFIPDSGRIMVPDLSATRLSISLLERFGTGGLHIGYAGIHGCRLSLFIRGAADGKVMALQKRRQGKARAYLWSTENLDFALMAVGMDPSRLDLIATDVFNATQTMQPLAEKTRMALRSNLQQSRTCVG